MSSPRKAQGEGLRRGFALARAQMHVLMDQQAERLRAAIAADVEVLARDLTEARAELAAARAEVARLTALLGDVGPSASIH